MAKKVGYQQNIPSGHEALIRRRFYEICEGLEERGLRERAASIAVDHHATLYEVLSGDRHPHVVRARDKFIVELRAEPMSYPAIGELLDMDHTSVISAIKRELIRRELDRCTCPIKKLWYPKLKIVPPHLEGCAIYQAVSISKSGSVIPPER